MDVKIDICATRRTDRWSWLNVILDELLDGVVHRLDGANARELLASDWAREASEGGSWAERRIKELVAGQYRLAQQAGGNLDTTRTRGLKIEIYDETPTDGAHGTILGPIDAYKCLSAPLTLFVEDADSDGEFWVTIWTAGQRERLKKAFDARRIEFAHCGGKTKIAQRFARWFTRRAPGPLRALVLKDSDKMWPNHAPTDHTKELEVILPLGTHLHVLQKREIENYLPSQALKRREQYDHKNPSELSVSIRRLARRLALERLSDEARSFYDMKSGFPRLKDPSKPPSAEYTNHMALFANVSLEDQEQLRLGISEGSSDKISDLFETARAHITREALEEVCDFEGEFVPILDWIEALL